MKNAMFILAILLSCSLLNASRPFFEKMLEEIRINPPRMPRLSDEVA